MEAKDDLQIYLESVCHVQSWAKLQISKHKQEVTKINVLSINSVKQNIMKTIENVTIYKCDFCKKELKRKHAMANHEEKCNSNPLNFRACTSGCAFLEREDIYVDFEIGHDYENGETQYSTKQVSAFKCTKFDKIMYPYSIEKSTALIKHPETFEYQEPMPKECDGFSNENKFWNF